MRDKNYLSKTLTKNKIFGSMILAMLGSLSPSFAKENITNSIWSLQNVNNYGAGPFIAGNTTTWSTWGASFSQSYLNGTLIFGNSGEVANTSGGGIWFGRGGDVGYITASFNAKNIYLTSTLGAGNSWRTGGGASLNFSATQKANLQSLTLEFYKAGTQNSNFSVTANEIEANNTRIQDNSGGTTSFSANTYNIQNLSIQKSGGKVVFNNKTSAADSGKGSVALSSLSIENGYFIAPNLKATLSIKSLNVTNTTFQTKDINAYALTTGNNASYTQSNGTTTITGDWNLPTNAGTTHNSIAISNVDNFVSTGGIAIQTWGAYSASFTVNNVKNLTLNSVHLDVFTGGDTGVNTFNFSGVSGKASINTLMATRGNITTNQNVDITNLIIRTTDFNPTTNFWGKNADTTYNITNLEIFGGWGATTKATAKFNSGKSLTIGTAKISNWSTLDAAAINNVKITTLESSYATIKAGANLEIDNATFSNNQTFLDSSGKITIGNITFNNGAELQIKSGQTLEAKNLIMHNGSALVAQAGNPNSNLSGDTTISKITFDNSRIYANNLTTQEITIQNNAQIWLKNNNSGLYKNEGTLNISDGSNLTVHGNMENIGSLNFTLNPNNTELINVSGYFQFNMDASSQKKDFTITNIGANGHEEQQKISVGIPKSRINIYTSTQDLITGQTYILIHAGGGFQFLQNGQVYTSLSENTKYGELSQVFAQNIYFYDNANKNKPMSVDFVSSTNNNTLSFYIPTLAQYVDITPYIKPGVWPFGDGRAVFGIMNGAGGLAKDYTLTLQPQVSSQPATKGRPVIYYLQNYTYHNSGNPNAVFTVNAIGSKFVLGKNRETAGNTGTIRIGDQLARSTMKVNADDIYLGGNIVLGDGALISGNLILNAANKNGQLGFIGSNDNNQQANIWIKNHSSLTAIGSEFNYQGTIYLTGNGTVSDTVQLNLNGITGGSTGKITMNGKNYDIYIRSLVVRSAKGANGGGIYAKNFYINTMQVNPGNYSPNDFMTNIGNSTINTLVFNGGTSGVDNAVLNFKQGGSLSVGTLELQNYGTLNASTLSKLDVSGSLSSNNSTIIFSKGSQEINIKNIVKFVNSTLSTSHFSSYGLSIGPNASFYQSTDDAQGYATMVLKGSYKVASQLVPIINNSNMVFTKLTSLTADTLGDRSIGLYGSSITLVEVKQATIANLVLTHNSNLDATYPVFSATKSPNIQLTIKNIGAVDAVFSTTHFSAYGLNTTGPAASNGTKPAMFYQSSNDTNGYASMVLHGTYQAISKLVPLINNTKLAFSKLSELTADTLEARSIGTYGSSITLSNVQKATIANLVLTHNSSGDTALPIFNATNTSGMELTIKNIGAVDATFSATHFSAVGLNTTGPAASNGTKPVMFYQSANNESGYATMVLHGTYQAISKLTPLINNSNLTFTKLTSLTAGTLEASPAGAYGSSIKLIDVQKATIQKIILSAPSAITNYPTFDARSSTNLNLNVRDIQSNSGYFYANNGGTTTISGQATFNNSVASFTNLDIAQNAALNYDSPTKITIAGNFNLNGSLNLNLTGNNLNTITIQGQTNIYLNNKNLPVLSVHNIEQLKNLKVGTEYILIHSIGGINYHYNGTSGNTQMYQDQMIKEFGFYGNSNKRLDSVNDDAKLGGFFLAKIIRNNRIGFKISTAPTSTFNPFNPNQIEYYFFKKGGQDWIYALRNINPQQTERLTKLYDAILKTQSSTAEASAVKEWLNALDSSSNVTIDNFQVLMIDKHNPIWAWDVVKENNLQYFQTVAKKIDNAIGQLGSVNNKASSANILRLATDTNRESRLVQLSSTKAPEDFASITESLKHTRFASKNLDLASIYRQEMRQRHKNNLWGKAVGAANFVNGGSGTLYGINVGYDRYVKNAIIGGYAAYAYSDYFGGLVQNRANNFNFGAYSRIFIEHGEIDINASTTVGWNRGFINSKEPITMSLNQNYHYNSYIENVNFTYGYIFYLQEKSLVLKPLVGISQYFVASSKIQGKADNAFNQDLAILASAVNKFALAFDAGLEMRKYMSATSYWYAHLGVSQDIFVMSGGGRTVTFVGNDTLRFFNNSRRNLRFTLLIGGEMKVYKRTFVNLGLGSKAGVFYKDIGVSGNVGVRYVF
ncbi:vacuolating cytotoxin domain-containing protein [Helicobacter mustelae]|uniref:Putative hypothetical glycine-rich autotransporter n=1 Tax=Helicobacter mustelae (strain ATCC 43772 / CCUG 25715 / CIP 103759 / LMG 18044 / NCTC 12198 / R85-136P) TaxID=679897 RepID=D3UHF9_HELM1|nr:vacuolating cytotoxin domain-containing protein [Helicobacter mustelae]CBG39931.1 putative hypothetical glycine-rich autotransporter [Helicobacter mustelae 12198]SQH71441.1 hypothetical glycine-rich autotransporter [Helicobacter mustelae]